MKLDPESLANWTSGYWRKGLLPTEIDGLEIDSRKIRPGEMFVALTTNSRDGHDFVSAAVHSGAKAALVARELPEVECPQLVVSETLTALQSIGLNCRKAFQGEVLAVVGSFGKTTVKSFLGNLLGRETYRTPGNLNNYLGVPLCLSELDNEVYESAVLEAGINQPGEMEGLAKLILPNQVVFTGIGPVHLEKLGTLENIAKEKLNIVAELTGAQSKLFCPRACFRFADFYQVKASEIHVLEAVGDGEQFELPKQAILTQFSTSFEGAKSRLKFESGPFEGEEFTLSTMSSGMILSAALSILTALVNGVQPSWVENRLAGWQPEALRGEYHQGEGVTIFLDCYNANPESLKDSLSFFRKRFFKEARLLVLGSMKELGERASDLHEEVAAEMEVQANEKAILIGEFADSFKKGFERKQLAPGSIRSYSSLPAEEAWIEEWKGAIFVKGSRHYQLEKVLELSKRNPC